LRHQLVVCTQSAGWAPSPVLRAGQAPPGALVVVFSPFLDDAVVRETAHARRRGNPVLAVDVLPLPLRAATDTRWDGVVARVLAAEHATRLAGLRARGVPVVRWDGGVEAVAVLRRMHTRRRVLR